MKTSTVVVICSIGACLCALPVCGGCGRSGSDAASQAPTAIPASPGDASTVAPTPKDRAMAKAMTQQMKSAGSGGVH